MKLTILGMSMSVVLDFVNGMENLMENVNVNQIIEEE